MSFTRFLLGRELNTSSLIIALDIIQGVPTNAKFGLTQATISTGLTAVGRELLLNLLNQLAPPLPFASITYIFSIDRYPFSSVGN